MVPMSRKRSSSFLYNEDLAEEPASKRQCTVAFHPRNASIHDADVLKKEPLFNDTPRELLMRSAALALDHVGFAGAQVEALETLCAQAETYAAHFLSKVTASMLNARRAQPTPLDFKFALSQFRLPLASLEPHLRPPIPRSKMELQFELLPPQQFDPPETNLLLASGLSGEPDKKSRAYVPKKFPSFPSKHTYKWTELPPARETDPRKIREQAAKEARHGEDALRHIHNIEKAAKEKNVKKAASKDPRSLERHELWEKTMEDLMAGKRLNHPGSMGHSEDHSIIVNAEARYFRKGALVKRKPPLESFLKN